jgi:hypothetical protein
MLAAGYVPASDADADLLPRADYRDAAAAQSAAAPMAVVASTGGLARLWSAIGPSGRVGTITAAVLTATVSGYVQIKRKLRAQKATPAGAAPIEFDLRHH